MSQVPGMKHGYGQPYVKIKAVIYKEGKVYLKDLYSSDDRSGTRRKLSDGRVDYGKWGFNDFDLRFNLIHFEYEYFDDKDHQAVLHFETTDVNIADNPNFQEIEELSLNWGYRGNMVERIVIIQGKKVRYLNDKIIMELECSTGAASQKNKRYKKFAQEAKTKTDNILMFVDWLNIRFGNSPVEVAFKYDNTVEVDISQFHTFLKRNKQNSSVDRNLTGVGTQLKGDESGKTFEEILTTPVHENGQSGGSLIEQATAGAPNGPWYEYTMDKKIVVHNRDKAFATPSVRYYNYRGGNNKADSEGDLLSFIPKISDKEDFVEQQVTFTVDEEGKIQSGSVVTSSNPYSSPAGSNNSPTTTEKINEERQKLYQELLDKYNKDGIFSQLFTGLGFFELVEGDVGGLNSSETPTVEYIDDEGNVVAFRDVEEIDNTGVVLPNTIQKIFMDRSVLLSGIGNLAFLEQQAINDITEREMLATSAKVRVIGDPKLKMGECISVHGVANRFSGKHYIMRSKHTINSSGYYVDMETLMESANAARIKARFDKLGKRTVDEKTGEVKIELKYDIETGIRVDFKLKVLKRIKENEGLQYIGDSYGKIIRDCYIESLSQENTIAEQPYIILDEVRRLILGQILRDDSIKGTDKFANTDDFYKYINDEILDNSPINNPGYTDFSHLAETIFPDIYDIEAIRKVIKAGKY